MLFISAIGFSGPNVGAAPAPEPLSLYTTIGFVPDGEIGEFIHCAGDSQEYFLVDPIMEQSGDADFGAIKICSELTPGVFVRRDNSPTPGGANEAGQSGHRDRPGATGLFFIPTGFNIGRVFASYNPEAFNGQGAYFLAMDISAPALMDSINQSQPIAFDIDGDGSRAFQTELQPPGTVSEAPSRVSFPDSYGFEIDTDGNGFSDVAINISERREALRFGAVSIDPNGVPQIIDGVRVRRAVFFDDVSGSLGDPAPMLATRFLDATNDGIIDYRDVGVGSDVEIVVRRVNELPGNTQPACAVFTFLADAFDDEELGGGGEDLVMMEVNFPVPRIEAIKEARCTNDPKAPFLPQVKAAPGSEIEFRVTIQNRGNRDLDVTIDDTLSCLSPATATLVAQSCSLVAAPPGSIPVDFCDRFEAALTGGGFPLKNIATLKAFDPCAIELGEELVFTYRVMVGPEGFNPEFCDTDIDCTNGVSVSATITELVDPILAPDPPTNDSPDGDAEEQHCTDDACCAGVEGCVPNDGIGDVPDEFSITVVDEAGVVDTPAERLARRDDNVVQVEFACRGITLTKEVRSLPGGAFQTGINAADITAAPVDIEYRHTVSNDGEVDEEVTIVEGFLCDDLLALMTAFPGDVEIVSCPLCSGDVVGSLTTIIPAGSAPFSTSCVVHFETEDALKAFTGTDDGRPSCQALTPDRSADESCYRNCSLATATASDPAAACFDGTVASESSATACHEICEIVASKQVRCLDNCTDKNPIGSFQESVVTTPGSCLEFRIDIGKIAHTNEPVCALRITDTLAGAPTDITLEGDPLFSVDGVSCTVPQGFNIEGVPFLWSPSGDCGLAALEPSQTLTITFNTSIPEDAAPTESLTNVVQVEGAALCLDTGPSFTCMAEDQAVVDVLRPSLTCLSKEWAYQWDSTADCEPNEPFSEFASEIDLQNKVFPVRLRMRVTAENTGGIALSVIADDAALSDCVAGTEGISFIADPACELGLKKLIDPGAKAEWLCDLLIESADAMRAMDACDGMVDGAYRNTASLSGTVSAEPDSICMPPDLLVDGGGCSASVLVPPICETAVEKAVKCSDDLDSAYAPSVETLPGSTTTFRVSVSNPSPSVKIPQVCVTDVLSCSDWFVGGSVTAQIGGDDVTACVASGVETSVTTGQRVCFDFGSCRPTAPWIAPGETLTIAFDATVPPSFNTIGTDSDCSNDVTVEVYSENCATTPSVDSACATGTGFAEIDVQVPDLRCDKFVCEDLNNDGECDNSPVPELFLPSIIPGRFSAIYWVFVENTGEAPLEDVRVCDHELRQDAEAAGFSFGACTLLDGIDGCSTPRSIAPGTTEMYTCRITSPSRSAWTTFARSDSDGDEQCYSNRAETVGRPAEASICGMAGVLTSTTCGSRLCVEPPGTGACCCKGRCPENDGACCTADVTEEECEELARDGICIYAGDGTSCEDNDGDGRPDGCQIPIPTVSTWGLVVLTLLFLTAAKIRFRLRSIADRV